MVFLLLLALLHHMLSVCVSVRACLCVCVYVFVQCARGLCVCDETLDPNVIRLANDRGLFTA